MGAIAVIIYNNVGGTVIMAAANGVKIAHLKIPAIFVLKTEGEALAKAVKTALVSFHCKALRASPPPPNRGSPLAPPLNPRGPHGALGLRRVSCRLEQSACRLSC